MSKHSSAEQKLHIRREAASAQKLHVRVIQPAAAATMPKGTNANNQFR